MLMLDKIKEGRGYNGIRESTLPRDMQSSSALRNDLDLKLALYGCVNSADTFIANFRTVIFVSPHFSNAMTKKIPGDP